MEQGCGGKAKVEVYNPVRDERYHCRFVIVSDDQGFMPLLVNKASQRMNLITVNNKMFKRVAAISASPSANPFTSFPDVFNNDLCTLSGTATFTADPDVTPEIYLDRRVLEALKEPLWLELGKLEKMKVIAPVGKPTDWVSNIVVALKKSGDLQVCINPQGSEQGTEKKDLSAANP